VFAGGVFDVYNFTEVVPIWLAPIENRGIKSIAVSGSLNGW